MDRCCSVAIWYFFFFKQKTAYDLRISDWSSDVCSSDLEAPAFGQQPQTRIEGPAARFGNFHRCGEDARAFGRHCAPFARRRAIDPRQVGLGRSEEHTSELQSLMRISYAVFCLKKKKQYHNKLSSTQSTKTLINRVIAECTNTLHII